MRRYARLALEGGGLHYAELTGRGAELLDRAPWLGGAPTGDVLAGIIGAFVARRADPLEAAAAAAHVHGVAASLASPAMIASDLLDTLGPAMAPLDVI